MVLIVLQTDSKNSLHQMRATVFASHSKALYARLPSVESKQCFCVYFYQEMVNSKLCSWEECKRDSRIPEKVV